MDRLVEVTIVLGKLGNAVLWFSARASWAARKARLVVPYRTVHMHARPEDDLNIQRKHNLQKFTIEIVTALFMMDA